METKRWQGFWNSQMSSLLQERAGKRKAGASVTAEARVAPEGFFARYLWEQSCRTGTGSYSCMTMLLQNPFLWGGGRANISFHLLFKSLPWQDSRQLVSFIVELKLPLVPELVTAEIWRSHSSDIRCSSQGYSVIGVRSLILFHIAFPPSLHKGKFLDRKTHSWLHIFFLL